MGKPRSERPLAFPGAPSTAHRRWSLHREGGAHYHVSQTEDGVECGCPASTFRRGPAGCKHIKALAATELINC